MHVCIVSEGYPYKNRSAFPFVKQLCEALADNKVRVSVVAPQSLTKRLFRNLEKEPQYRVEETTMGNKIEIYAPTIVSFGNFGSWGNINFRLFQSIVTKVIQDDMPEKPDVLYGHFWHSAYAAYPVARKLNKPLFVATGESVISLCKHHPIEKLREFTDYVSGVICVSSKNMNESVDNYLTTEDKCEVVPNAIDLNKFNLRDKLKLRQQMGYQPDDFIVAFVGAFIHRKGANRVAQAIMQLNDPHIKSIFIGGFPGSDHTYEPQCKGMLFKGSVKHDEIVDYLNCADVFVLPTLNEGCCNAIIEAMACGLPIISSDKSFNYDILDETCSILIDPMNIDDIADAIALLKGNTQLRLSLVNGALKRAANLTIDKRAKRILQFIKRGIPVMKVCITK